ncbi:hypothetical protein [Vagococcus sp. WN89Y]|uniref:hypothetical protein n=1 Tax=Vagococcus sp. WN89Y TaxID=3457258 RepID=UPI003FCDABCC
MSTGTQLIESMATMTVSKEMLEQVDIHNLLNAFTQDYEKLDDLKKFRQRHEDRNAFSRWWNNDELESAQLNAAELQASFSKKLGQLMVISIAQSQQLNQQQAELAEQQQTIKSQTAQLARNDKKLEGQHQRLEEQNQELEKLVREYFALKGLTDKGAKKLIEIAQAVQQTRDDLLDQFDKRMALMNETCKLVDAAMERLKKEQARLQANFQRETEQRYASLKQETEARLASAEQQFAQSDARAKEHAQEVHRWLEAAEAKTQHALTSQDERWQASLEKLRAEFEATQRGQARSLRNWRLICTPLLVLSLVAVALLAYHSFFPLALIQR